MQLKIIFSNKMLAGIIFLICILVMILYLPNLLGELKSDVCTVDGICLHEGQVDFLNNLIPVFLISGIAIGALVFYFMTNKLDNKKEETKKIVNTLINFLNKDEKKILEFLIDNNGKAFQSEISRLEGIGKLKSHRVLAKLIDRGVIETEKHGKTNIVKLNKQIKETLYP